MLDSGCLGIDAERNLDAPQVVETMVIEHIHQGDRTRVVSLRTIEYTPGTPMCTLWS